MDSIICDGCVLGYIVSTCCTVVYVVSDLNRCLRRGRLTKFFIPNAVILSLARFRHACRCSQTVVKSTLPAKVRRLDSTKYMFNTARFGNAHTTTSISLHESKPQRRRESVVTLVKKGRRIRKKRGEVHGGSPRTDMIELVDWGTSVMTAVVEHEGGNERGRCSTKAFRKKSDVPPIQEIRRDPEQALGWNPPCATGQSTCAQCAQAWRGIRGRWPNGI